MAYLTAEDISRICPRMATISAADQATYLPRANAYARGIIGGQLPAEYIDDDLRAAVALAYEVMATGDTATADPITGNITELGPNGFFLQKKPDPLAAVDKMLRPYQALYASLNTTAPTSERGMRFL